jgi:hypothetical protein
MAFQWSGIAASTAAVTDRLVTSTNMKVGAYALAHSTAAVTGGFLVTVAHTSADTADTLGTIVVVGKNLAGQTVTETITPVADSTVTGAVIFGSITSVTGVGWAIDGAEGTNDTLVVGTAAGCYVMGSGGVLHAIVVNATAAASVAVSDARGTIATLKASIGEGTYYYDAEVSGYLKVATTSTNDLTVLHSGTLPNYATS